MARLRASWRTSLPVVQQPRNPQSESIARSPYDWGIPGRCLWASSHRVVDETRLRQRFEAVRGQLDERGLRLMAAAEARAAGDGGIAAVARATGIARSTIGRGLPTWISRPYRRAKSAVPAAD